MRPSTPDTGPDRRETGKGRYRPRERGGAVTGRHLSAAAAVLSCLALVLALSGPGAASEPEEPVRIGAVFSLSGEGNFVTPLVGTPMEQAVKAVVEEINGNGGVLGRQIELSVEDDRSDTARAAAATRRLAEKKRVSVILGPSATASAPAMISTCEREQVPLIVTGPAATPLRKWVFLLGAGQARGAERIADFAVSTLKAKRIGVLNDTSDYAASGTKVLLEALGQDPGVSVVVHERFAPSDIRLSGPLSSIKAASPDLLILYTNGASAAVIAKEYERLGMRTPVLGSHGVPTSEFLALAGNTAEEYGWVMIGAKIAVAGSLPADDPYRRDLYDPFLKLLKARYGPSAEPSVYQAAAYDGIMAAVTAIKAAGTDDRAAIRDALERIRLEGFTGPYACSPRDHQASPRDTSPAMVVKHGEYVAYGK